jgi:hypothetical protein
MNRTVDYPYYYTPNSFGYERPVGESLGSFLQQPLAKFSGGVSQGLTHSPGGATLTGSALGGLLGLAGAYGFNKLSRRPLGNWALLAGALGGAALGGGLGRVAHDDARAYNRKKSIFGRAQRSRYFYPGLSKQSSFFGEDESYIVNRIMSASDISSLAKQHMISLVSTLPEQRQSILAAALKTSFGSAIGVLIAKYLMGWGIGGMVLGGLIGGALTLPDSSNRNRFGQIFF